MGDRVRIYMRQLCGTSYYMKALALCSSDLTVINWVYVLDVLGPRTTQHYYCHIIIIGSRIMVCYIIMGLCIDLLTTFYNMLNHGLIWACLMTYGLWR